MADDNKKIITEEDFPAEVDEFIDGLIEEGYDIEDIEAVLTDDDFLAKLDDLDAENEEDEGELLDEMGDTDKGKKKLKSYMMKAAESKDKAVIFSPTRIMRVLLIERAASRLSKEEAETMMKDISKGKLGFGKVTPILANAAYCAIKRMPEDERAGVIEDVWDDQDAFRLLITSQN